MAVLDFVALADLASVDLAYAADDIVVGRRSDFPSFGLAVLVAVENQIVDRTLLGLVVLAHYCSLLAVQLWFSVDFRIGSTLVSLAMLRLDSDHANLFLAIVPCTNAYSFRMPVI